MTILENGDKMEHRYDLFVKQGPDFNIGISFCWSFSVLLLCLLSKQIKSSSYSLKKCFVIHIEYQWYAIHIILYLKCPTPSLQTDRCYQVFWVMVNVILRLLPSRFYGHNSLFMDGIINTVCQTWCIISFPCSWRFLFIIDD